jgi:chemotaxis signal transduction protein
MLYRGTPIPVIDLSELLLRRSAHRRLNTRLVIVRRAQTGGEPQLMGLIVEGATRTFRFDGEGTVLRSITTADGGAGVITLDQQSLIQQLDLTKLMPSATDDGLDQASLAS